MKIVHYLMVGLGMLFFLGFIPSGIEASDKIKVSVSVLPQAYFVERIGGDRVETQVMIPMGASPANSSILP